MKRGVICALTGLIVISLILTSCSSSTTLTVDLLPNHWAVIPDLPR